MPRKSDSPRTPSNPLAARGGDRVAPVAHQRPSSLLGTRVIYCGDCLDQLRKLPDGCIDRLYLWHRFPTGKPNTNRNHEVFTGALSEPRAQASGFPVCVEDRWRSPTCLAIMVQSLLEKGIRSG
jgi:hypothetical protein